MIVAGRVFVEHTSDAFAVGAALATTTSVGVDRSIMNLLRVPAAAGATH